MIHEKTPVTMAEVKSIVDEMENKDDLKMYLKTFTKLSKDKALKLVEEINEMGNIKIKPDNAVKIADFMPSTIEDVRKIFVDTSLTDEEANAIINVVAKY